MKTRNIILIAMLLLPVLAWAGANETPGENGKPHKFSSFSANLWEFGADDVFIFEVIVVGHQHYAQGATYSDDTFDLDTAGAGLWNFFEFCSNSDADVMLVTTHGENGVGTLIADFPDSLNGQPVGENHRDSLLTYYNGIFGAGCLVGMNYDGSYGIVVTQQFYTNYLMTPQAFAWWATCYSDQLSMTATAEARCFLGYDDAVLGSKCNCDELTVLSRMDGQEGQQKRPLEAALQDINFICPDTAWLWAAGELNTVLSPSVIDYWPQGIVCDITPGWVVFDTSMDTNEPPGEAAKAYGDGFLINQVWTGDDRIDFLVIPTTDWPTINYHAHENRCRSVANRARLDGNTFPTRQNALGPNRDDFVWDTICPGGWLWVTPTPSRPSGPTPPGYRTPVSSGLTNHSPITQVVTVTLVDTEGWCTEPPMVVELPPESFFDITWEIEIPADAPPGLIDTLIVEVTGDFEPQQSQGELIVQSYVEAEFLGDHVLLPGADTEFDIRISNYSEVPAEIVGLNLVPSGPITLDCEFSDMTTDAGGWTQVLVFAAVPSGEPDGQVYDVTVEAEVDGTLMTIGQFQLVGGLPIRTTLIDNSGIVVGRTSAPMSIELENAGPMPWMLTLSAFDSNGFIVTAPPDTPIGPGEIVPMDLFVDIPADPGLIGMEGHVLLEIIGTDIETYSRTAILSYTVGPAVEIGGWELPEAPFYTGTEDGPFPWTLEVTNLSDQAIEGSLDFIIWEYESREFYLPAGGTDLLTFEFAIDPLTEPGLYPGTIDVFTMTGLGNQMIEVEAKVTTPVTVTIPWRAVSGEEGELVALEAVLENLRPGMEMAGDLSWGDSEGWIVSPPIEPFMLPPGDMETRWVEILIPPGRTADSDSIWVRADMFGDAGQPLFMEDNTWLFVIGETVDVPEDGVPAFGSLDANYPNPFNPTTLLRFHLASEGRVSLTVHDLAGRRVATLESGVLEAGTHERTWRGRNESGKELASGVYLIRLETSEGCWSRKAVLVR